MFMWRRSSNPQPHPTILPHLRRFEMPDMVQSGGCSKEALWTRWDSAADCGLLLTHWIKDLAWPGTQKKKNAFSIGVRQDTCKLTCSTLGIMLDRIKFYSINQDQRVTRKLEFVHAFCWKVAWNNPDVHDGLFCKETDWKSPLYVMNIGYLGICWLLLLLFFLGFSFNADMAFHPGKCMSHARNL